MADGFVRNEDDSFFKKMKRKTNNNNIFSTFSSDPPNPLLVSPAMLFTTNNPTYVRQYLDLEFNSQIDKIRGISTRAFI